MKIAIMNCQKADVTCTAAGCMKAFNARTGGFAEYGDQPVELVAFMHCNGCGQTVENNESLAKKIERLEREGVEALHVGICTKKEEGECPTITGILAEAEKKGIRPVRGTH